MKSIAPSFYSFSGMHAFLMGLLPFYLPVLIWQRTESLAQLFVSIAVSGFVFYLCLPLWRHAARRSRWSSLITASFVLEFALIAAIIFVPETQGDGLVLGLINGIYMCFYWMTLRALFCSMNAPVNLGDDSSVETPTQGKPTQTGKSFGNFQILVMIALKIGMIAGAFLIDTGLLHWLLLPSVLMLLTCSRLSVGIEAPLSQIVDELSASRYGLLSLKEKLVFAIEGSFLYLESFAWVLSIYWLIGSEIVHLGVTLVALGIAVAILFWLIRSIIDTGPARQIFQVAVVLYAFSWVMRAHLSAEHSQSFIALSLLMIAFMTTLFRLSFNKAFFDRAHANRAGQYIYQKSQVSQLAIGIGFGVLAIATFSDAFVAATLLNHIYWLAAPLSLVFFWYAPILKGVDAVSREATQEVSNENPLNRTPIWRTNNS